jgi:hypothetical protein
LGAKHKTERIKKHSLFRKACVKLGLRVFTTAKLCKQPKSPTTDPWIKKMWYIYTKEYYLAVKKNEIVLFAGKWMELEIIKLSEVNQVQKDMFSVICGS